MRKPQRQTAFRIPTDLSDAMQAVKDRDGIPQSEQVRRAIREWLERRGEKTAVVPSGKVLVHDHVWPTRKLGARRFRAWLSSPDPTTLEVCGCDWAPELGQHFRVRAIKDVKIDDGRPSIVYEHVHDALDLIDHAQTEDARRLKPRQPKGRGKR